MINLLPKHILETSDVATITPVRGKLLLIPKDLAQKYEVLSFDGDGKKVCVLTTNTYSEQLKIIYSGLEKSGYVIDIYYTDNTGIQKALSWYEQLNQEDQAIALQFKNAQEATGTSALDHIMSLYTQRSSMDPGEFLIQVIKFAFQAGASDMHRQSEE